MKPTPHAPRDPGPDRRSGWVAKRGADSLAQAPIDEASGDLFRAAVHYRRGGDEESAARVSRQHAAEWEAAGRFGMAVKILMRAGLTDEAQAAARRAIPSVNPNSPSHVFNTLHDAGLPDEARTLGRRLADEAIASGRMHWAASMLEEGGLVEEARATFAIVAQDDEARGRLVEAASSYRQAGMEAEALRLSRAAGVAEEAAALVIGDAGDLVARAMSWMTAASAYRDTREPGLIDDARRCAALAARDFEAAGRFDMAAGCLRGAGEPDAADVMDARAEAAGQGLDDNVKFFANWAVRRAAGYEAD